MTTIDDKIVYISLDAKGFESGTKSVLKNIEDLKAGMQFKDAGKGLSELNKHVSAFSLEGIAENVKNISSHFSALGAIGFSVLQSLTQGALHFGKAMLDKILDPIIQGGKQRALNIENAKFQFRALGQNVDKMMASSLAAVKGTAYGLDEAAKAAGQFGAAGIDAGAQMTSTLRGVAGIAAVTNSSFSDISQIFTTMAGTGKVNSMQLYQFATRGLNVAAALAKQWNTTEQHVRQLASQGKISFKQFAGAMDDAFGAHAQEANQTFTGALANMKAALARVGADFWTPLLVSQRNVMNALTPFFDNIHTAMMPVIDLFGKTSLANADRFVKMINGINLTGLTKGMPNLAAGIKNILTLIHTLVIPLKDAFRDVFPASMTSSFVTFTKAFKNFTATLKPSPATLESLRHTFAGLFAILDIGKQILAGILTVFGRMFGVVAGGTPGLLNLTGTIGDFFVSIDKWLKKGDRLKNFFETLTQIIAIPMGVIGQMRTAILNLFGAFDPSMMQTNLLKVAASFTPFQKIIMTVHRAWDVLVAKLQGTDFTPITDMINKQIAGLGTAISNAINNMNFQTILDVIRTGLFGGIVLMFKQFLGRGSLAKQLGGAGGGIIANISGVFAGLNKSMMAMQQNIKAKTLKEIAIAVALLTASVVALSFVDPQKLQGALAAMTIGFGELVGVMFALTKVAGTTQVAKIAVISFSLILLAGALDLLSLSVLALSQLSWQEMIKGLAGVSAMLAILVVAIKPLTANSKGLITTGIGLIAVATGLRIMANAVQAFGTMNLETLGKGLASVAVGLGILALGMRAMPKGMIAQSAALVGIAVALRVLANVVVKFGAMSFTTIAKGMVGMAGALVIIAGAMRLMPKGMVLQAAGLVLVAVAIGKISEAVAMMGGMSIGQIAKGLITLAASLAILAAGLYVMEGAVVGAAALTLAAVGVSLMAGALAKLGKLSWVQIMKGLVGLAAVFALIGAAGLLLTPTIPTLLGFGAALVLVGAGLALAGAGIAMIALGISALVISIPMAVGILLQAIVQLEQGLINTSKSLALGLLEIIKVISAVAPKLVDAIIKIISSLLDGIIQIAPKLATAIMALLDAIVKIFAENQDKIVAAGMSLVIALLQGVADHISQVVQSAANIIIQFVKGIVANMSKIIALGIEIVASLYSGIIRNYTKIITAGISIITKFIGAIASNIGKIVTAGANIISKLISGIGSAIGNVVIEGMKAVTHFVTGMGKAAPQLIAAATNMIIKIMNALSRNSVRLADAGATAVINFLNGMARVLRTREPELMAAGFNIGSAIVQGMTNGLTAKGAELLSKAKSIGDGVVSALKKAAHVKSPSQATHEIGVNIIQGMINGLGAHAPKLYTAAEDVSNGLIDTFNTVFKITSPSKVMYDIGKYVGQGFAQGLRGSTDDIKKVWSDLNKQLTDAMRGASDIIVSEQKKLNEERKASKPDAAAIKEAQRTIKENQAILERSRAAHTALVKTLNDEKRTLLGLAKNYSDIADKLKEAKTALDQAKTTRDEAIKGFGDKYSSLPDIVTKDAEGNAIDQLATYEEALAHQAAAVGAYHSTLDQLRKLGLDDATYQKLLDEGTADQQFADQLLSGGKTAVDSLNKLDSDLQNVSKTLAINAGNNLYQAGVDAAQGLVSGLASQASEIQKTMDKIAAGMVKALKKKLKIKSPSEIFAEIGKFSMEGMAQGFTDSSKLVTDSIEEVSNIALTALQASMRGISDIVSNEIDANPVITPVLDLTQVRSQSEELAALTQVAPTTAGVSTDQASAISSAQTAAQVEQANIPPGGTSVKFEQNNYSPEALSEIEIYRQTKNSLSQIKSALALT